MQLVYTREVLRGQHSVRAMLETSVYMATQTQGSSLHKKCLLFLIHLYMQREYSRKAALRCLQTARGVPTCKTPCCVDTPAHMAHYVKQRSSFEVGTVGSHLASNRFLLLLLCTTEAKPQQCAQQLGIIPRDMSRCSASWPNLGLPPQYRQKRRQIGQRFGERSKYVVGGSAWRVYSKMCKTLSHLQTRTSPSNIGKTLSQLGQVTVVRRKQQTLMTPSIPEERKCCRMGLMLMLVTGPSWSSTLGLTNAPVSKSKI